MGEGGREGVCEGERKGVGWGGVGVSVGERDRMGWRERERVSETNQKNYILP